MKTPMDPSQLRKYAALVASKDERAIYDSLRQSGRFSPFAITNGFRGRPDRKFGELLVEALVNHPPDEKSALPRLSRLEAAANVALKTGDLGKALDLAWTLESGWNAFNAGWITIPIYKKLGMLGKVAELYEQKGMHEDAAKANMKRGRPDLAAPLFECISDYRSAAKAYLKAGEMEKSTQCLARAGDPGAMQKLAVKNEC